MYERGNNFPNYAADQANHLSIHVKVAVDRDNQQQYYLTHSL